jgi:toxin ParE1/3/4
MRGVLLESARNYGLDAAERYGLLILVAIEALDADRSLPGTAEVPRLRGVRAYSIRLAKLRVMPAQRVGSPRHLVVYRVAPDGITEILGLVHDRMVLSRAARRLARGNDMS